LEIGTEDIDEEIVDILVSEDLFEEWPNSLSQYDHEYLCKELVKICADCYKQFDPTEYDNAHIVITAFQILATLGHEDAIPLFIKFITQDEEFT